MIAAREGSIQVSAILLNYGAKTFLNNAYGDNALLLPLSQVTRQLWTCFSLSTQA